MRVKIFHTIDDIVEQVISELTDLLQKKPNALICVAGGSTPLPFMKAMVSAQNNGQIDFKSCHFVGLDEWGSIGRETFGSCAQTLYDELYTPLGISEESICFFEGKNEHLEEELKKVDEFIQQHGGIDYILLGIGMNGHIGFNEPGVSKDKNAHIVPLDDVTKSVMKKYFHSNIPLEYGLTLGFKQIISSGHIVLVATEEHKAEIVLQTMQMNPTIDLPATLLKNSENANFYVDKAAGSKLIDEKNK